MPEYHLIHFAANSFLVLNPGEKILESLRKPDVIMYKYDLKEFQ